MKILVLAQPSLLVLPYYFAIVAENESVARAGEVNSGVLELRYKLP